MEGSGGTTKKKNLKTKQKENKLWELWKKTDQDHPQLRPEEFLGASHIM